MEFKAKWIFKTKVLLQDCLRHVLDYWCLFLSLASLLSWLVSCCLCKVKSVQNVYDYIFFCQTLALQIVQRKHMLAWWLLFKFIQCQSCFPFLIRFLNRFQPIATLPHVLYECVYCGLHFESTVKPGYSTFIGSSKFWS
jgi:hypothetical protein